MARNRRRLQGAPPPAELAAASPTGSGPAETRAALAAAAALGLAAFVAYALTLYPSVPGGDSGELAAVACRLSVAHPPGYPLYTLLARLFLLIPHGSPAWRVNLMSAACDSAAASLLCLAGWRWSRSLWAGVLAGGLFAFAPLTWTYAVQAEVFGLNNLFSAGALLLAALYLESRSWAIARMSAFWIGLGLANHHTLAFLGAPLAGWMLWTGRAELLKPRRLAVLAAFFAAGLLPYLYLPWAASRPAPLSWGDTGNWDGFWHHLLRKDYGTFRLGGANDEQQGFFWVRLGLALRGLPAQLAWVGLPLAAAGIRPLAGRGARTRGLALVVGLATLGYVALFTALSNLHVDMPLHVAIAARFWQMAYLPLFLFAGAGLATAVALLGARGSLVAASVAILAVGGQAALQFRAHDQSGNRAIERFARATLEGLPQRAILMTQGDYITHAVGYLQACEADRPDVALLEDYYLTYPWGAEHARRLHPDVVFPKSGIYNITGFDMRDFLDANLARRPVYTCNGILAGDDSLQGRYLQWPMGLVARAIPSDAPLGAREIEEARRAFASFDAASLIDAPEDSWESQARSLYLAMEYALPERALALSAERRDPALLRAAIGEYERLAREIPHPNPLLYKNMGVAYQELAKTEPAARARMIAAWRGYLSSRPPADDKDLPAIRAIVDAEPTPKTPGDDVPRGR